MCTDCFDDVDEAPAFAPEAVIRLARRIEAEMSGDPVPPRAWSVYVGEVSGALDWRALERIARAMDGARLVARLGAETTPRRKGLHEEGRESEA